MGSWLGLCSVFLPIAYPLWFHCGVDKASVLDHFSGIAINILFSIAPPLFGQKGTKKSKKGIKKSKKGSKSPKRVSKPQKGVSNPQKEVAKVGPPLQLLWQAFWPKSDFLTLFGLFGTYSLVKRSWSMA